MKQYILIYERESKRAVVKINYGELREGPICMKEEFAYRDEMEDFIAENGLIDIEAETDMKGPQQTSREQYHE